MRAQGDLLNRINLMLPVQSPLVKIFPFSFEPNHFYVVFIPAHTQGAFRDRHERRAGDAMDAGGAADESAGLRTAKSCGPDASMVGVKLRRSVCEVTVTTKPDHRGEHEGSR
jgi:hypothetical protein